MTREEQLSPDRVLYGLTVKEILSWPRPVFNATFEPKRLHTLKPEMRDRAGMRVELEPSWEMTEEDGGSYVGQIVFHPVEAERERGWPYLWIPEEDLAQVWRVR